MIKLEDAKNLAKKIEEYSQIIIVKHQRADWDAQGSALGMAYLIQDNWNQKTIYVPGERLDQNQDFLPDDKMNQEFIQKALLISVDTANAARLDFSDWKLCSEIIKFDHHIPTEQYGTINIVDEKTIACAQMVTEWGQMLELKFSPQAARNLYKGIVTDSGRFLFPDTNADTFKAAAFLLNVGFDFQAVNNELYVSNLKMRQWSNYAFSKMQLSPQGVAYILLEEKDYQGKDLDYNQIKTALSTMAGIIEIKIWFTVIAIEGEIKVSLRSREYDVNSVAMQYHGGGHQFAAGAKLNTMDEHQKLLTDLNQLIINTDQQKGKND